MELHLDLYSVVSSLLIAYLLRCAMFYGTYELPLSLSTRNLSLFGLSAILSRSFLSLRKLRRSPVGPRLMSVLVESTDCARTSVDWLLIEDRSDTESGEGTPAGLQTSNSPL